MKDRFFTFALLVGSLGAIVLGVLIGGRIAQLSDDALAWAGGALFGCAVMLVPIGVLLAVGYFALRWREAGAAARPVQNSAPPVVIVSGGQALPWYPPAQQPAALPNASEWESISTPRKFTVVGGEDD